MDKSKKKKKSLWQLKGWHELMCVLLYESWHAVHIPPITSNYYHLFPQKCLWNHCAAASVLLRFHQRTLWTEASLCVCFFYFSLVKQIKSVEWCSSMKKTHYPPPLWQIKIILVERFLGVLMSVQIPCCL